MCLSKAWFREESKGRAIMEDIAKVRIENGKVILSSLYGEERIENATLEEVDFTHNTIMLKRT
jgi:predicted RNA-binding protein